MYVRRICADGVVLFDGIPSYTLPPFICFFFILLLFKCPPLLFSQCF